MSKDTEARAFFPGYVLPAALALLILYNLWTGNVYWPQRGYQRGWAAHPERWTFWGTILMKLGTGASLYAWYVLANDSRREHLARPIVVASVAAACLGLVMVAAGFADY